jgi:protein TonB
MGANTQRAAGTPELAAGTSTSSKPEMDEPMTPLQPQPISEGWLGAQSYFAHDEKTKIGRAMTTSLVIHAAFFAALILAFATGAAQQVLSPVIPLEFKMTAIMPVKGPGGGGGGSPAPAPKKPVEIPKTKAPVTIPVEAPKPVEPPPLPELVAPVQTNTSNVLQSSGTSLISLAAYGGGGRGGGVGSGTGNGVGPGTGGGFGGGAFAPGNGVTWPTELYQEKPKYTSDAMRAKIQGDVHLEIVVSETGTVTDARVIKSLDKAYGLDQAAIEAAKKWKFKPGLRNGVPVATKVELILSFRLH